jgi:ABC-2 type transport system permease protein
MKVLAMQMRREIWEHRSLWIAPLLVALLLLVGVATLGRIQLYQGPARPASATSPFELMLLGWGVPFYLAAGIVIAVYLLDCLYGERRDRSILFWRSMPVSDTETVIAKLLVGLVAVPYATFLLAAATSVLASAILALRQHVLVNGQIAPLWNTLTWLHMQLVMLSGLTVLLLWYAPYATYLMLASVWARRSPYAWAFVPPVLLAVAENMVFGTNYLGRIVERGFDQVLRLAFNLNLQFVYSVGDVLPLAHNAPRAPGRPPAGGIAAMLTSPQLWLGLLAAALMLTLAIRLRRYRDDS